MYQKPVNYSNKQRQQINSLSLQLPSRAMKPSTSAMPTLVLYRSRSSQSVLRELHVSRSFCSCILKKHIHLTKRALQPATYSGQLNGLMLPSNWRAAGCALLKGQQRSSATFVDDWRRRGARGRTWHQPRGSLDPCRRAS